MTALAIKAFAPVTEAFKYRRGLAAWLGLVPKQFSAGGKERLGRASKAGQSDIRHPMNMDAMSRRNRMAQMIRGQFPF